MATPDLSGLNAARSALRARQATYVPTHSQGADVTAARPADLRNAQFPRPATLPGEADAARLDLLGEPVQGAHCSQRDRGVVRVEGRRQPSLLHARAYRCQPTCGRVDRRAGNMVRKMTAVNFPGFRLGRSAALE